MDETRPLTGARDPRRLLAGRYVLQGLLGQGGMADVELAYDQLLDRQVAIKILHQRYASDPQFIARFRREAQAAASLNHPNVVAVYDTGEQDGRPFIVMEYVAGRSLKEVLAAQGVLPERAADIAVDAAAALHYAHERGLVHRDVKPGNIMVSDEGQVKVTDFGIARAVGAESVTQTAAIFGTAAYVSPEQAQGEPVDRRSDVYSLGCVLYEMLTGQQPFAADSAVALAYKHVSEDPVPPTHLNPEIAATLEAVTMKAMAKDPGRRYPTARDFAADVQRAVHGMAVSAPPVLVYERTQPMAAAQRTAVMPTPPAYEEQWYTDERARRGAASWAVMTVLVVLGIAAAVFLFTQVLGSRPQTAVVPNVVGLHISEAQRLLRQAGFEAVLGEQRPSEEYGENEVIATDPPPNTTAERDSVVTLIYSDGAPVAEVPRVEGLPEAEAQRLLREAGFRIGSRLEEASDEVERGSVIRSDPPGGTQHEVGAEVSLVISTGQASFELPNVEGLTEPEARQALETACDREPPCVRVVVSREFHDTVPEGRVIRQSPGPGAEAEIGDTVTIVLSRGPEAPPTTPPPTTEPSEPTEPPTTEPSEPTESPTENGIGF